MERFLYKKEILIDDSGWGDLILGVVIGALFGLVLGGTWYGIIKASGNPQLLYFEELSNGETCSRPSKQTFKCAVYKNGKLIKNL